MTIYNNASMDMMMRMSDNSIMFDSSCIIS